MISNKILAIQKDDILLDCLNIMANKTFRIEEIPKEEMEVSKDELLIPCAHFQKVRHLGVEREGGGREGNSDSVITLAVSRTRTGHQKAIEIKLKHTARNSFRT